MKSTRNNTHIVYAVYNYTIVNNINTKTVHSRIILT